MTFDDEYLNIGRLDRLSYQDTLVHRLDPRAKVIATVLFIFTVVSYSKYAVIDLAPFFLFPVLMVAFGDIPVLFLLKKILIVSPFAIFIGIFNPIFDPGTIECFGRQLSAGWVSFLSILVKFVLTISAAFLLIATTSFPGVCHALRRFGLPSLFVSQLLFLYRYLFVLMEEALRMMRARDMRSFGTRGTGMKSFVRLIGTLFVRTVERAERIYSAMLSRGFRGDILSLRRSSLAWSDLVFVASTAVFLAVFRMFPVAEGIGDLAQELFR